MKERLERMERLKTEKLQMEKLKKKNVELWQKLRVTETPHKIIRTNRETESRKKRDRLKSIKKGETESPQKGET